MIFQVFAWFPNISGTGVRDNSLQQYFYRQLSPHANSHLLISQCKSWVVFPLYSIIIGRGDRLPQVIPLQHDTYTGWIYYTDHILSGL